MNISQLNYLAMVRLDISVWSARAKLKPEDLPLSITRELPPDDISTLGTKRLFSQEKIKVFNTLKARASAVLDKKGVRFLGGWATHEDRLPDLAHNLSQIAADFQSEKEKFLRHYVEGVAAWAENFPKWAHILINAVPKLHEIEHKFSFSWQMFKIAPQDNLDGFVGNNLTSTLTNLERDVMEEAAKDISLIYKESFQNKETVHTKSFRPIKTLADKVRGLGFIHPQLVGLEKVLHHVLSTGENSADDPQTIGMVKAFLVACSTPQGIQAICQDFVDNNKSLTAVMDPFWIVGTGVSSPAVQPPSTPMGITLPAGWSLPTVTTPTPAPAPAPAPVPSCDPGLIAQAIDAVDNYQLRKMGIDPDTLKQDIPEATTNVGVIPGLEGLM